MKARKSFNQPSELKTTSLFNEAFISSPFSDITEGPALDCLVSSSPSLFSDVDLIYEGCQLDDILGKIARPALPETESVDCPKIVENRIDNIEPSETFYESSNLKNSLSSTEETIQSFSEAESFCQMNQEFRPTKRRTRKVNNPLLKFRDNPYSNMKKGKGGPKKAVRLYPKKEYYRTKLIRSWKRFIRLSLGNKISRNGNLTLFEAQQFVFINKEILSLYAPTKNGPLTEGHGRRHKEEELGKEKTFNNRYVKLMFQNNIVRESFRLFVLNEFFGKNCDELVERFDFSCCEFNQHVSTCDELWKELKVFSVGEMIN